MNLTKRVIILDKVKSPTIAQAIFILRDDADNDFSAIEEAERVVREYMASSAPFAPRHRKAKIILSLLGAAIGLVCIFIALI